MAPPLGVHVLGVVGQAQLARHRQHLRGEGLVELDHVDAVEVEARTRQHLARGRRGADAHDAGRDARARHRDDAGAGLQPVAPGRLLRGHQNCAGAVVHARRVAGGHGAAFAEGRRQPRQPLKRGLWARMLVARDNHRVGLALRHRDRVISLASRPSSIAAPARRWLRKA